MKSVAFKTAPIVAEHAPSCAKLWLLWMLADKAVAETATFEALKALDKAAQKGVIHQEQCCPSQESSCKAACFNGIISRNLNRTILIENANLTIPSLFWGGGRSKYAGVSNSRFCIYGYVIIHSSETVGLELCSMVPNDILKCLEQCHSVWRFFILNLTSGLKLCLNKNKKSSHSK